MEYEDMSTPIRIPVVRPLTTIEHRAPYLRQALERWNFRVEEARKVNAKYASGSIIAKATMPVTVALGMELTTQNSLDSAHEVFTRTRTHFHATITKYQECFHQAMALEERAPKDPKHPARWRIDELWNMFADDSTAYGSQFLSYFAERKLEAEAALRAAG